jgi:hypothetical protein
MLTCVCEREHVAIYLRSPMLCSIEKYKQLTSKLDNYRYHCHRFRKFFGMGKRDEAEAEEEGK